MVVSQYLAARVVDDGPLSGDPNRAGVDGLSAALVDY
jgi:hypothetical protein